MGYRCCSVLSRARPAAGLFYHPSAVAAEQRRAASTRVCRRLPPPPLLPPLPCPTSLPLCSAVAAGSMEVPSRELFIGGRWVPASQRLPVISPLVRLTMERRSGMGSAARLAAPVPSATHFVSLPFLSHRTSRPSAASQLPAQQMWMLRWLPLRLLAEAAGAPPLARSVHATCAPLQPRCACHGANAADLAPTGCLSCHKHSRKPCRSS